MLTWANARLIIGRINLEVHRLERSLTGANPAKMVRGMARRGVT
jgi:hypothetical protein